ncbi:MAG: Flp/Fap pilin component [Syntrophorhabdus sp. PtaU1.Bin153]|nr:MAG: Flp/Fap pilin component [Syntrophorhabdus sp. PtaU1.Bin153]
MIKRYFWGIIREEEGVTALEYGLIGSIVSVAIILSLPLIGVRLSAMFQLVANCFR